MIEAQLEKGMFNKNAEKTFVDKLLAKQIDEQLKNLVKKERLNREDVLEILYLISSVESKLLAYSEWDRYVILKFFVWVREHVTILESLFDYVENLEIKENQCRVCKKYTEKFVAKAKKNKKGDGKFKPCGCKGEFKAEYVMKTRTYIILDDILKRWEHGLKFLVDLYLNIGRTSLSINGTALKEFLTNKYEMDYKNGQNVSNPNNPSGIRQ